MSATTQSRPRIVAISLKYEPFFDQTYANLFTQLLDKANVQRAKKPASALDLLHQLPPPAAVLITDQGLTEGHPDVWDAVITYVRQGGTAIAMGHFSSFVKPDNIRPFFTKAGLDWDRGAYHRTTVTLNPQVAGRAAASLPGRYSQKALFLKGVQPTAVMYGPDRTSVTESHVFPSERVEDLSQAAIAFAQVGNGKIGYVGDVNVEEGTDAAILVMCGLLV
ncbi:triacylglycerol lipase-like protein [Colletotrichum truncatum]|uniref:Triacylglycerol lipase-like protein n=1 Tax=Colletotrichum truncatum TaxID=5467 RepID=A0ACC3Z1Z9_COLTU